MEDEINDMRAVLRDEGRVPRSWFHPETAAFDALGPPGSTVRVFFGRHAGQFVVIGATHRKRGRGKLAPEFAGTLRKRLREWQVAYPGGRTQ